MSYHQYEKKVVQRYGVELVGWTSPKLVAPSHLGRSVPQLKDLLDALMSGACHLQRLTNAQLKERVGAQVRPTNDGVVIAPVPKPRKKHSDTGKKRGPKRKRGDDT